MRHKLMAGNWKMYKTPVETRAFFDAFKPLVAQVEHCDIVICPPFPNLPAAVAETRETSISVGAQNLYWGKEGAVTGEVSGHMIEALGCTHVIVAHSERRQYFNETEEDVLRKTMAAIDYNLTPIVCLGEQLREREDGATEAVLVDQFEGGLGGLASDQFERIVIAYEPVWAIGTGKTATPEMASEAHAIIRREAALRFGDIAAQNLRILYGGSVKPDNCAQLMRAPHIDGALVGGASLDPQSFGKIVNFL